MIAQPFRWFVSASLLAWTLVSPATASVASTNVLATSASTRVAASASLGASTLPLQVVPGCVPEWIPTFGELPGVDARVSAFAVWDDGNGAALYAAGAFGSAGGVASSGVARFDGERWIPLGLGTNDVVNALAVFDDGTGAALYAAGAFTLAGGAPAARVAKWNGTIWAPLGAGLDAPVLALVVHEGALYAGGSFSNAGGAPASRIARWNGVAWSPVGTGIGGGDVSALASFVELGVPKLFAGGTFATAGALPASRIARFDGTSWSAIGLGTNDSVDALAVHDEGNGPRLFVAGRFTTAGGIPANRVARWNGTNWSALGRGVGGRVTALASFDDGTGAALYAGGTFTSAANVDAPHVARWKGGDWTDVGGGTTSNVGAFAEFRGELYAGGDFTTAGGVVALRVARWDGVAWKPSSQGPAGVIYAATEFDDGTGPALYVGGDFLAIGGIAARHLARWNGVEWSEVGGGTNSIVYTLQVAAIGGTGRALYVGGIFSMAGGAPAASIARWDGVAWSALGGGVSADVYALASFRAPGGTTDLYVGGLFDVADGAPAAHVARWDGTSWFPLGSGTDLEVRALRVFDDGTGRALYAGGAFVVAGGAPAAHVARWDGTTWSTLGVGVDGEVRALETFDGGSGTTLVAAGSFTHAGGGASNKVARWNGTSWSSLGSGMNNDVLTLATHDDGNGQALYAGGYFTLSGGTVARRIARWNGTSWSGLGNGVSSYVSTITSFDDRGCTGPVLIAGGGFTNSLDSHDSFLARWGCANPPVCANSFCAGDGIDPVFTTACPCANNGAPGHGCASSVNAEGALLQLSGGSHPDTIVLAASGMPATVACVYLQGDTLDDAVFGDGVRCTGGTLLRLRTKVNQGGASSFPDASDTTSLSQRGGVTPGSGAVRYYQTYYRNASVTFCPPSTFNVTNGWKVTW